MTKGPGFFRASFFVPGPQQIRALNELSTTGAKCIVLPEQKYQ
jgi:hypothetical protein